MLMLCSDQAHSAHQNRVQGLKWNTWHFALDTHQMSPSGRSLLTFSLFCLSSSLRTMPDEILRVYDLLSVIYWRSQPSCVLTRVVFSQFDDLLTRTGSYISWQDTNYSHLCHVAESLWLIDALDPAGKIQIFQLQWLPHQMCQQSWMP